MIRYLACFALKSTLAPCLGFDKDFFCHLFEYCILGCEYDCFSAQKHGSARYFGSNTTWCNQATMKIVEETGANHEILTEGDPNHTTANDIASRLDDAQSITQYTRGSWKEISGSRAQGLANLGTLVIAAWNNPIEGKSGHVATVAPNGEYSSENGPTVANVGRENGRMSVRKAFGVDIQDSGASSMDVIRYYHSMRKWESRIKI